MRSQLHGERGVARGAHAGVDDHGHLRLLQDDPQVGGLRMPMPEPIGAPSGITAAAPASSSLRQTTGSSFV